MFQRMRRGVAVAFTVVSFAVFGVPLAGAQTQDGLVNVNISDNTVTVPVAVAAQIAANACDIDVGPVGLAVLGTAIAVDRSGRERTICTTDQGPVTISQNTEN